ncbi:MAG: peptide ABC transporter permease [Gemmatimonadales bacterium]|nr:Dipeptide transport system permease protein DppB [bacterium HR33]GIW51785.1 MAG: peptide ABC transporter permease [Gemmatimonadales bacterium]
MIAFVTRRLAQALLIALGVVTLTFILLHAAPGDPFAAAAESPYLSPQAIEQARRNYGLDRPLWVQYLRYVGNLARGDMGVSFSLHRPVSEALLDALPNTLLLAAAALILDFGLGITVGTLQGMRAGTRLDRTLSIVTLALFSTPVFWLGLMLLLVFSQTLGLFPVGGVTDPVLYPSLSPLGKLLDRLWHLCLPAWTLGLVGAAGTARYQRAAILEVVRQDFIRAARARGLSERAVAMRHALRNALLPTITLFGLTFPVLLSGAVLVETVFSWPGMGKLTVDAVLRRDYPLVLGATVLAALMVVLGNLLADLAYRVADPRTREER